MSSLVCLCVSPTGEGLKVGALSLIRAGQKVVMSTSLQAWTFVLQKHPDFNEVVLAVEMTGKGTHGTCRYSLACWFIHLPFRLLL